MKKYQKTIDNCQAEIDLEKSAIQSIEADIETKTKQLREKIIPHKERIRLLEETISDLSEIDEEETV